LYRMAGKNNITFTNFRDDLSFSSKMILKFLISELLQYIKSGRFYLHHKKISCKEKMPEVTGILISKKGLTVNSVIRKRAKVNQLTMHYLKRVEAATKTVSL
jgi:hypothetical protein